MELTTTFGDWLKQRRRARDLSREALAELVSCAAPTLAKIEQGARRPSRELAALLLDALQAALALNKHRATDVLTRERLKVVITAIERQESLETPSINTTAPEDPNLAAIIKQYPAVFGPWIDRGKN